MMMSRTNKKTQKKSLVVVGADSHEQTQVIMKFEADMQKNINDLMTYLSKDRDQVIKE